MKDNNTNRLFFLVVKKNYRMIIIKSPSPVILYLSEIVTSSQLLALPKTSSIFWRILVILSLSYFAIRVLILPISIGLCRHSMVYSKKSGLLNR